MSCFSWAFSYNESLYLHLLKVDSYLVQAHIHALWLQQIPGTTAEISVQKVQQRYCTDPSNSQADQKK